MANGSVNSPPSSTVASVSDDLTSINKVDAPSSPSLSTKYATPHALSQKPSRRCLVDGCQSRPAPIIGECRYCSSKFCASHRLPESHICQGLSACKTSSRMLLSERLLNEKCVAEKL